MPSASPGPPLRNWLSVTHLCARHAKFREGRVMAAPASISFNRNSFDKARLDRLRARALRHGYRICKSRERMQHSNNRGGLQIVEVYRNLVVGGVDYDLDVEC